MERESSLIKNSVVLAVGTFFPKFVAIITLPLLTGYLTQEEYGYYDLITTLVSLLLPVATLQIQSAAFRFLIDCRGDKEESSRIVNNIFIVSVPISAIALVFVFIGFGELPIESRVAVSIYYFVDIMYLTLQQIARGLSYNKAYSIATCILSIVNLFLLVILIAGLHSGLFGVLLSLIVSNGVACIYLMWWIRNDVKINIKKYASSEQIKDMLAYSWPMVPNNLSNWALSASDRIVITVALGIEANAVYAVASKIPNLLATLQGTFTLAWQENASIAANDEDASEYYSNMFITLSRFLCGALGCLIAATPVIFRLLISGNYEEAYYQMPILFMGILFSCIAAFLGGIYVAKKNITSVGVTTVCAAGINLLVDILFVKRIGIYAGSISTLIAYFALMVFRMIDTQKRFGLSYKIQEFGCLVFYVTIVSGICYWNSFIGNVINCIIVIPMFFVLNKNIVKQLYWKIMSRRKAR